MASVTVGTDSVSYLYNGMGQRVKKSGPTGLVQTGGSHYLYDESGQLLGEYDANGNPLYETVYLGSMPVGAVKQTGTAATSDVAVGVYNVYADHIATPRMISAQDETVVWRWDAAEAFGATAPDQNPSGLGAFAYNQRFPGQVFDAETGLFQNWNRDYRATWGRYAESDPIGLGGGINTFTYVGGSPLSYTDKSGLAQDGVPLNAANCEALMKLLDYEDKHGKFETIMKYNALNFSPDMTDLDAAFPSKGGEVSIDWMMRSAGFGATTAPGTGLFTYSLGKQLNNGIHGNGPWTNIGGAANFNAPAAMSAWYYGNSTLRDLFAESIEKCKCGTK